MGYACTQGRHTWELTAAAGWFRCRQAMVKGVKRGMLMTAICQAVVYCPGCLGARLSEYHIVLCQAHGMLDVNTLPLVSGSASAVGSTPSADQPSFW